MPITLDGTNGITTPTYGGADTSEYLVPVTQFKNRIINGAMVIDQRNAGASVTQNATYPQYCIDRWMIYGPSASKFTAQQNAGSVTPPAGFSNYLGITSLASTSVAAGDIYILRQPIEGFNTADLNWGTANAKTVTLSFWVRSSLTGTFGGSIGNSDGSRSYPYSYTISSANTWEFKSVTITGDTTGTWVGATNGIGIQVYFGLGVGSTFSSTAGAWAGSDFRSATGATSVVGTNGATFYITGVQLEVGSTATSFDYRPYGTELQLCQRYFEKSYDPSVVAGGNSGYAGNQLFVGSSNGSSLFGYVTLQTPKRAQPTITIYPPAGGSAGTFDNGGTVAGSYIGLSGFGIFTTTLTGSRTQASWIASAEL